MTDFIPSECLELGAQRGKLRLVCKSVKLLLVVRVDKSLDRFDGNEYRSRTE